MVIKEFVMTEELLHSYHMYFINQLVNCVLLYCRAVLQYSIVHRVFWEYFLFASAKQRAVSSVFIDDKISVCFKALTFVVTTLLC
jgi:hypothetical protein